MTDFDPRLTLARPDLADLSLEGIVRAQTYRAATRMQASAPVAPIRKGPRGDAEQVDQLVFGEGFEVLDEQDGFAWGRAERDGYVGWVDLEALSAPLLRPTHRVRALRTYAWPEPDYKTSPVGLFSMNALVAVKRVQGAWAEVERAGWMPLSHLADLTEFETDPAAVAERFVGAPYQWGGRESLGLDCSGLVQQALYACGLGCPRDADMQERALGRDVDPADLRRGDLVFWTDHVGIMLDDRRVIHATSAFMATVVEPLSEAAERRRAQGLGDPTAFRRL